VGNGGGSIPTRSPAWCWHLGEEEAVAPVAGRGCSTIGPGLGLFPKVGSFPRWDGRMDGELVRQRELLSKWGLGES